MTTIPKTLSKCRRAIPQLYDEGEAAADETSPCQTPHCREARRERDYWTARSVKPLMFATSQKPTPPAVVDKETADAPAGPEPDGK